MDKVEHDKLYNIRIALGVAAMRIGNEEGVETAEIDEQLEAIDAMLDGGVDHV